MPINTPIRPLAIARARRIHRRHKPVLFETQPRQAVVATIVCHAVRRKRCRLQTVDAADPGVEPARRLEIVLPQPAGACRSARRISSRPTPQALVSVTAASGSGVIRRSARLMSMAMSMVTAAAKAAAGSTADCRRPPDKRSCRSHAGPACSIASMHRTRRASCRRRLPACAAYRYARRRTALAPARKSA